MVGRELPFWYIAELKQFVTTVIRWGKPAVSKFKTSMYVSPRSIVQEGFAKTKMSIPIACQAAEGEGGARLTTDHERLP